MSADNYEFLYYTGLMSFLIILTAIYYKKLNLTKPILLGLTALGFIHVLAGNLYLGETRLYDLYLIDNILKFDNVVHMLGGFMIAMVLNKILRPYTITKEHKPLYFLIILVLLTLGVGAAYEIIELLAVLFLNAATQVGDYLNNAFDIVFNAIGAIIACTALHKKHKK